MNKSLQNNTFYRKYFMIHNKWGIMLIASILALSYPAIPQQVPSIEDVGVKIASDNKTLRTIFSELEELTAFNITYDKATIGKRLNDKIVIQPSHNMKVSDVLKEISKQTNIKFRQVNKNISAIPPSISNKAVSVKITDVEVSGTITDENGEPLVGASIVIKGTSKGTITDVNGNFALNVQDDAILVVSFIGFATQEISVGGRSIINVQMKTDIKSLEEVVVVGYGQTDRRDVTGSISSVKVEDLEGTATVSVDNALVGQVSGVQVIKADGSPGGAVRIKVRGGTSLLGNNDPLYVIDGVPIYNTATSPVTDDFPILSAIQSQSVVNFDNMIIGSFLRGVNGLAGINIENIKSIDILKDASATAIYGSKAANGVVIITTHSGSYNQKLQIDLSHTTSISEVLPRKVMNAQQFKEFHTTSAKNLRDLLEEKPARPGLRPNTNATKVLNNPESFFGKADTDWLGLITRRGVTNNTSLSVSGGGRSTKVFASVSYMDQQGTIINTDFNRFSGISRLEYKFSDRLDISTKVGLGITRNNLSNGEYAQALVARPDFPVFDENGNYSILDTRYSGIQNPIALSKSTVLSKIFNLNAVMTINYKIVDFLTFTSRVSTDMNRSRQKRFVPSFVYVGDFSPSLDGRGNDARSEKDRLVVENFVTINKEINDDNRVNVVLGTAWEKFTAEHLSASGQGYPDNFILTNLGSAAKSTRIKGGRSGNSLLSYYTRANYSYKDKFLLNVTGRADASSKFSPANRWAIFPSVALAWRISNENFMQGIDVIDELKIRGSIGKVGTQNIGDYLYRTLYTPFSYAGKSVTVPTTLGNNVLKWEETLQKDLGLDFGLFQGRLSGTIGVYTKDTDGQLLNISIAPSSGFKNLITNIASISNKGWEIDLKGVIMRTKNFKWNSTFNISHNVSKVTNINGGPFSDPLKRESFDLGTSIVKEGEPLGLLYGEVSNGIIRNEKELNEYRKYVDETFGKGNPLSDRVKSRLTIGSQKLVLDKSDLYKRDIIGNSNPDFFGGFSNTFTYKNISLHTLFNFSYGNELMWQRDVISYHPVRPRNFGIEALNHWSPNNKNSKRPTPVYGTTGSLSDSNVYDASFVKLKQVTLSYNFSKSWLVKYKIQSASISASASNVFVITNYPGLDPEVSDNPSSIIGGGRDTDNYPLSRTYSIGLRVRF